MAQRVLLALLLGAPENSQAGPTGSLLLERPSSAIFYSRNSSPIQRPMAVLFFFSNSKPRGHLLQPHPFQCFCGLRSWVLWPTPIMVFTQEIHRQLPLTVSHNLCFKTSPCCSFLTFPWMVVVKIKLCFSFGMESKKRAYTSRVQHHDFPLDYIPGNFEGGKRQLLSKPLLPWCVLLLFSLHFPQLVPSFTPSSLL